MRRGHFKIIRPLALLVTSTGDKLEVNNQNLLLSILVKLPSKSSAHWFKEQVANVTLRPILHSYKWFKMYQNNPALESSRATVLKTFIYCSSISGLYNSALQNKSNSLA